MDAQTVITDVKIAADVLSKLAAAATVVVPGAEVAGIAVSKIAEVVSAAAQGSADAVQYIADIQALAASTTDPTPEQWAALDAQTDADVQKLEDSTKPSA
jgi:hypothetical protein